MMTWEGFGSKRSWPDRGTVPKFVWKNGEKPGKYLWKRQCPGRDSEKTPEYVSRVLLLRQPLQFMLYHHHTYKAHNLNAAWTVVESPSLLGVQKHG
jgi:hypothetical protein